jgi:putative oxidoreductase
MPAVGIAVSLIIEVLGGLAILVGLYTRLTAWVVFLYLIPTTFIFHNFWAEQGAERINNMIHFQKNLAIMGGLLVLAAFGAGSLSIDSSRASKTATI